MNNAVEPRKPQGHYSTIDRRSDEERAASQRNRSDRSIKQQQSETSQGDYLTDEDDEMGLEAKQNPHQPTRKLRGNHSTMGSRSDEERAASQRNRSNQGNGQQQSEKKPRDYKTDEDDEIDLEAKENPHQLKRKPGDRSDRSNRQQQIETSPGYYMTGEDEEMGSEAKGSTHQLPRKLSDRLDRTNSPQRSKTSPRDHENDENDAMGPETKENPHAPLGKPQGNRSTMGSRSDEKCATSQRYRSDHSSRQQRRVTNPRSYNTDEEDEIGPEGDGNPQPPPRKLRGHDSTMGSRSDVERAASQRYRSDRSSRQQQSETSPGDYLTDEDDEIGPEAKQNPNQPTRKLRGNHSTMGSRSDEERAARQRYRSDRSIKQQQSETSPGDYLTDEDDETHLEVKRNPHQLTGKPGDRSDRSNRQQQSETSPRDYKTDEDGEIGPEGKRNPHLPPRKPPGHDTYAVDVIGSKKKIDKLQNNVQDISEKVQERQEYMTKEMDIPIGKLQVLLKKGIKNALNRMWPRISVCTSKKDEKMMLSGNPKEIIKAMKVVQNELKNIIEYEVSMTPMKLDVISSPIGSKHIKALLHEKELCAFIECDTDEVIITGDKATVKQVEKFLSNEIIETSLPISQKYKMAMQSQEWDLFIKEYIERSSERIQLKMKQDMSSISIAAIAKHHGVFTEQLMKFLEENHVKEQFLPVKKRVGELLNTHSRERLKEIELANAQFSVKIVQDVKKNGFLITGTSKGLIHAVKEVEGLFSSEKFDIYDGHINVLTANSKKISIGSQNKVKLSDDENRQKMAVYSRMDKITETEDQKKLNSDKVRGYAKRNPQHLTSLAEQKEFSRRAPSTDERSSYVTVEGLKIEIVVGEIAKQKAAAFVNSMATNLDLSEGALSRSIMNAMSAQEQKRVKDEARRQAIIKGKIECFDFICTTGGDLECTKIYHVIVPPFNKQHNTAESLMNAFRNILMRCHFEGMHSLAIPAIGTGKLLWPPEIVAQSFFDAVISFSSHNVLTKLKRILIVIQKSDAISLEKFNKHMMFLKNSDSTSAERRDREKFVAYGTAERNFDASPAREIYVDNQFGNVILQLKIGDIAAESTDGIVNSTDEHINLSIGAVAQALAKRGGERFVQECRRHGNIKGNDVVVTKGAGNLLCKYVIHVNAQCIGRKWTWRDMIKKCLDVADAKGMKSLSFPALGTGIVMGRDPAIMAMNMMEGVAEFSAYNRPTSLTLVKVVIFQPAMFQQYYSKMEEFNKIPGLTEHSKAEDESIAMGHNTSEEDTNTNGSKKGLGWSVLGIIRQNFNKP